MNAIYPNLAQKLGFWINKININSQKIDKSYLNTFNIIIAKFSAENKLRLIFFFEKTFLLSQTIPDMVLKMLFLTLIKV